MFAAALCGIVLTSCGGNSAGSNETDAGETATQSVEVFTDNSLEGLAKRHLELYIKAVEAEKSHNYTEMEEYKAKAQEYDKKFQQLSKEDQKRYQAEWMRLEKEYKRKR